MTSAPSHLNTVIKNSSQGAVVVAQLAKAVAFDTKGPLFKCSHLLNFIPNMYLQLTVELDDHEEKQAGNGLFIKDI